MLLHVTTQAKEPCRSSKTPGIQQALSDAYLKAEGLFSLRQGVDITSPFSIKRPVRTSMQGVVGADVIIATFCIENKLPLLYSDKDFKPFVKHLQLAEA